MKKNLLTILLPVILALGCCSLAVWANEQSAPQPPCGNCAKLAAEKPCGGCPKGAAAVQGCDKCAKLQVAEAKPSGAPECDNCAKFRQGAVKPCCDKNGKGQPAAKAEQQGEVKPCCAKGKSAQ